jgi:hypothetical protein
MTAAGRLRSLPLALALLVVMSTGAGCSSKRSSSSPRTPPAFSGGAPGSTESFSGPPPTVRVAAPPAPTGAVEQVPASIAHDCSVDVAAALQSWIDTVPDNSTLSFRSNACYRSDAPLRVIDRHRLLIDGNGATLKAVTRGGRNRSQLVLSGGSDLTVRNLIARGANPTAGATPAAYHPDLEAQHGFVVSGATNVLLDHVQAYDTYGDFVYIGFGPRQRQPSRDVTVANSRFERSGRQGISVTWGVNVTIEANVIRDVARSMFDLEANTVNAEIRDIRIVGNVTGAAVNFWLANKGYPANIGNVQIAGNRMVAGTGGLIFVFTVNRTYRGPFLIEHNQFIANNLINDENSSGAFFFAHCAGVTIRDNDVSFPKGKGMPAVELRDSRNVQVTGNRFTDAGRTIIASDGSSDYHAS